MHCLPSIDMVAEQELENELRRFFGRLHRIKRTLVQERSRSVLNRIQRARCRENLYTLERLERDFYALQHPEDTRHLYRKVHRYVKLDGERLIRLFGEEQIGRCSLFVSL